MDQVINPLAFQCLIFGVIHPPSITSISLKMNRRLPPVKISCFVLPVCPTIRDIDGTYVYNGFKASGDLRNLISTVNGLPEEYSGKCEILCNDWNELMVGHNLVILHALLSSEAPVEEVAELSLHLMYSPFLTATASSFLNRAIWILRSARISCKLPSRVKGILRVFMQVDALDSTFDMLLSTYGRDAALRSYHRIMQNTQRQDYRDRYTAALRPGHQLAFSRFRQQGVLAPFSLDTTHFTEPNR